MTPPPVSNPHVPQGLNLMGVFAGDTAQHAVFVASGWPDLGVETGTLIDGPFPNTKPWLAPYNDGWLAQVTVPLTPQTACPTLFWPSASTR
jgi:hypothetical protein